MPKRIDVGALQSIVGTLYPSPFDEPCRARERKRLGDVAGLTQFGVNLLRLPPGAWSSQRHWHDGEDEFVVMLSGEAVLVEDEGRTLLRAGDCAAWPKGSTNGHHLRNESESDCVFICVGGGTNTGGGYSDIDMMWTADDGFVHKDGSPY